MQFRDLSAQYEALKPEINAAVSQVFSSGRFIGGKPVTELEEKLANYVGVKHCITCANGTDALQLALMSWGVGPGDAVFVPDFTFFSSGEVVAAVGATPVFVDVDLESFNIDPKCLEETVLAIEEEGCLVPRVVVAVDLFGLPADYPEILQVCDKHDLLLLEDGAQGFGGSINGKKACSFGDVSTTSFFPAKPLGCFGDGGAIFTDNDEWGELIRSLAVHGKGSMKYDNVRIGMNSRLDAVQAAILLVKFDAFASHELYEVNEFADVYDSFLCDLDLVTPKRFEGFTSSWAQYTIRLPEYLNRDLIQESLMSHGVPTMVYYPKPMHKQKAFEGNYRQPKPSVNTELLCGDVLSLPFGPYLNNCDIKTVVKYLKENLI